MAKVLRCSDVGFECDGVIRAETEEEVLKQAAEHAKSVHNLEEISDEVVEKVRAAIQDEQGLQRLTHTFQPVARPDHTLIVVKFQTGWVKAEAPRNTAA